MANMFHFRALTAVSFLAALVAVSLAHFEEVEYPISSAGAAKGTGADGQAEEGHAGVGHADDHADKGQEDEEHDGDHSEDHDDDHDEHHDEHGDGHDDEHDDEHDDHHDEDGDHDHDEKNSIAPVATPAPGAADPATSTATDDADDVSAEASPEVTPEFTPEVTPIDSDAEASPTDEEEDDGSACFPSDAIVELKDGSTKRMDELAIGDAVRTGSSTFSKVFMFTHKDSSVSSNFIKLTTASGASVTVTKNHYLYADGSLVASQEIALSSKLMLASGEEDVVTAISSTEGVGLYNPQTVDGNIVVGGVLASTYTASVDPNLAHGLLAPFRAAYNILGLYTSAFDGGSQLLADVAPDGAVVVM